jgi:hypothetical protein
MKTHTQAIRTISRLLAKATDRQLQQIAQDYDQESARLDDEIGFNQVMARDRAREAAEKALAAAEAAQAAQKARLERKATLRTRMALHRKHWSLWQQSAGNESEFQRLLREAG